MPKTIILNYSREKKQNVKRGKNKRKKKKKGGRGQFEDPRGIWVVEHVAHHWEIKKKKNSEREKLLYTMLRIWVLSYWGRGVVKKKSDRVIERSL